MWNEIKRKNVFVFVSLCLAILVVGCRKKTLEELENELNEEWGSSSSFYDKEGYQYYFVFKYKEPSHERNVYLTHSHLVNIGPQLDAEGYTGEEALIASFQRPCVLTIGNYLESHLEAGTYDELSELTAKDVETLVNELKQKNIQDVTVYESLGVGGETYHQVYPSTK